MLSAEALRFRSRVRRGSGDALGPGRCRSVSLRAAAAAMTGLALLYSGLGLAFWTTLLGIGELAVSVAAGCWGWRLCTLCTGSPGERERPVLCAARSRALCEGFSGGRPSRELRVLQPRGAAACGARGRRRAPCPHCKAFIRERPCCTAAVCCKAAEPAARARRKVSFTTV